MPGRWSRWNSRRKRLSTPWADSGGFKKKRPCLSLPSPSPRDRPTPCPSARTRCYGAPLAAGARRLQSHGGTLLHAPAHALPAGGERADSVDFRIRAERRGESVSPCGVVKWFDLHRGVGLISQGAGPDVQAEASAIHGRERCLLPGEEVIFDITLDGAGLRADNIHRAVSSEARHPGRPRTVTLHKGVFSPLSAVPPLPEVLQR
ncbi:cold shock domain-containing protein [Streptomyces sp. NPDC048352]|uniref:cold shock domain-containing protein n=1 Tax=Streptomyces sp. NPDC048352 TaxID=3154718 RepID=UPI0034228496